MTTAPLSLEHLIRPSQQDQGKPPVIFLFHGYGSNEEDLFSFAPELPQQLCVISARAPIPLPPFGHAWYAINFVQMDYHYGTEAFAGVPAWITELIIPIAFILMAFRYFLLFLSPPRSDKR